MKPPCNIEVEPRKKVKSSVPVIPPEIIHDILLKLPVKTLGRFKAVCKSWNAFVSDPQFTYLHLKVSTNVNYCKTTRKRFSTTAFNKFSTEDSDFFEKSKFVRVLFHKYHHTRSISVIGSCDGLLLVDLKSSTLLWNPATGEYKAIARGIHAACGINERAIDAKDYTTGLAYNSLRDEYEALLFVCEEGDATIHSCGNRSSNMDWEKVGVVRGFPYHFRTNSYLPNYENGITFNGALHWAVSDSNTTDYKRRWCNKIIYFDTAEKKFERLPIPSSWEMYHEVKVAVLEGCLCTSNVSKDSCYHNVWSMKHYGVNESWTKLFAIPSTFSLTPLITRKKGNELVYITCSRHVCLYNKVTLYSIKRASPAFNALSGNDSGVVYTESLVSP